MHVIYLLVNNYASGRDLRGFIGGPILNEAHLQTTHILMEMLGLIHGYIRAGDNRMRKRVVTSELATTGCRKEWLHQSWDNMMWKRVLTSEPAFTSAEVSPIKPVT